MQPKVVIPVDYPNARLEEAPRLTLEQIERGELAVRWRNDNESLTILLSPCVVRSPPVSTMAAEQLTYAGIAGPLGISAAAVRAVAGHYRLVRSLGDHGKTLVSIDLAEIKHHPLTARRPPGDQAVTLPVSGPFPVARSFRDAVEAKGRITALEGSASRGLSSPPSNQRSSGHQADFEYERDRCDQLRTALGKMIAELQAVHGFTAAARTTGDHDVICKSEHRDSNCPLQLTLHRPQFLAEGRYDE